MNDTFFAAQAAPVPSPSPRRGWGLRFSLRTLLFATLLVAVYFGGRASLTWRYALAPSLAGDWEAKLPAGFVQKTTLQDLGEGQYLLRSRASVFNGKYQWNNGVLAVTEPDDDRMVGLTWKWDGQKLTLVNEPKTGSNYTGTILGRPQPPAAP